MELAVAVVLPTTGFAVILSTAIPLGTDADSAFIRNESVARKVVGERASTLEAADVAWSALRPTME
jgi:hypothetical protein